MIKRSIYKGRILSSIMKGKGINQKDILVGNSAINKRNYQLEEPTLNLIYTGKMAERIRQEETEDDKDL